MLVASLVPTCDADLWLRCDHVSAFPIHAITLSDSGEGMQLLRALVAARPELLGQRHEGAIFTGENLLHILIVNGREDVLCDLIDIAEDCLCEKDLRFVYEAQANGLFFRGKPQVYFGATPISCTPPRPATKPSSLLLGSVTCANRSYSRPATTGHASLSAAHSTMPTRDPSRVSLTAFDARPGLALPRFVQTRRALA